MRHIAICRESSILGRKFPEFKMQRIIFTQAGKFKSPSSTYLVPLPRKAAADRRIFCHALVSLLRKLYASTIHLFSITPCDFHISVSVIIF